MIPYLCSFVFRNEAIVLLSQWFVLDDGAVDAETFSGRVGTVFEDVAEMSVASFASNFHSRSIDN